MKVSWGVGLGLDFVFFTVVSLASHEAISYIVIITFADICYVICHNFIGNIGKYVLYSFSILYKQITVEAAGIISTKMHRAYSLYPD